MDDTAPAETAPAPEPVALPDPGTSAQITPEVLDTALLIIADAVEWAPPLDLAIKTSPAAQIQRRQQALAIIETLARRGFAAELADAASKAEHAAVEAEKAARANDLAARRQARREKAGAGKAKPAARKAAAAKAAGAS